MELKIPPDEMTKIVSAAILEKISAEQRTTLISDAIQHLLQPSQKDNYYGGKTSPLQEAFRHATVEVARIIVLEELQKDGEFKARIRELTTKAFEKLASNDQIVSDLAHAIAAGFSRDR